MEMTEEWASELEDWLKLSNVKYRELKDWKIIGQESGNH